MPFNGSGVYTPPAADFPVVTNTVISSTHFNNTINDIATGLTTCLTKDGQTTPTANIKLGGFKLTGVGAPSATNDALTFGQPATVTTLAGTTVTASTSVVTPLVGTGADVQFGLQINGVTKWALTPSANSFAFTPVTDNALSLGQAATRIASVFTPSIDSGTTGSLSLKTNNGQTQVTVAHVGSTVNRVELAGAATSGRPSAVAQGEAAVGMVYGSGGTGSTQIVTSGTLTQFEVLHTTGSTRNITVTGSNGGNPTISTTAGSLAITPEVVVAGARISVGTSPALSQGFNMPYSTAALNSRNSAGSTDVQLIQAFTRNSIVDICRIGASSNGTILQSRSGGAAPTTSDLNAGEWTLWRDTGGATTKLYYNNAGSIQSVALA